jgi:hypothetical protein
MQLQIGAFFIEIPYLNLQPYFHRLKTTHGNVKTVALKINLGEYIAKEKTYKHYW